MSEYQVESFIEGEMQEGKEGTLKELVENAKEKRKTVMEGVDELEEMAQELKDQLITHGYISLTMESAEEHDSTPSLGDEDANS